MSSPAHALVPGVAGIAVLCPGAIGDFMFALPALHALRLAYPQAHITLLGKPWQVAFLAGRPGPYDEVVAMPPYPGIGAPPDGEPDAQARAFVERLRARRFDLACQMYGGGCYSNPFIQALGARVSVGAAASGAMRPDRWIAQQPHANHSLMLLQVAALAGAPPCIPERALVTTAADRALAAQLLPPVADERIVILHPGSSDARRCWAPERFAEVADALAAGGARVVLSGDDADHAVVQAVARHMRTPPTPLQGELSLGALCGLLERARLIVANDTGPLHLALALGKPAVGVFWFTNLVGSGTLWPQRLAPAVSARVHCPVCGAENLRRHCGHMVSFVDDVGVSEVTDLALSVFLEAPRAGAWSRPAEAPG